MPIPLLPTSSSQRHENAGARCWGEINHSEQLTAALIQRNAQPGKTFLHSPRDTTCIHCLALPQSCIQQLFISNSSSHVFKRKKEERETGGRPRHAPGHRVGARFGNFQQILRRKGSKPEEVRPEGRITSPSARAEAAPWKGTDLSPSAAALTRDTPSARSGVHQAGKHPDLDVKADRAGKLFSSHRALLRFRRGSCPPAAW